MKDSDDDNVVDSFYKVVHDKGNIWISPFDAVPEKTPVLI